MKDCKNNIYFDNAATAVPLKCVIDAINEEFANWCNPNAVYSRAVRSMRRLEEMRDRFKDLVRANGEVLFVSSVSEGNSLVLRNSLVPVVVQFFEHSSIKSIPGVEVVDFAGVEERLKLGPALVSVSLVQHETGLIIDYVELRELVHHYGGRLHIDASQGNNIDCAAIGADYVTISSHKHGGPVGIAAVVTKHALCKQIFGGAQEFDMRAGTQAMPLIAGFVAALEENARNGYYVELFKKLKTIIRKELWDFMLEKDFELPAFYSGFADHLLSLRVKSGSAAVAYFDLHGFEIANSSACKRGRDGISVIGQDKGIRVSFGWQNTADEVQQFCDLFRAFEG